MSIWRNLAKNITHKHTHTHTLCVCVCVDVSDDRSGNEHTRAKFGGGRADWFQRLRGIIRPPPSFSSSRYFKFKLALMLCMTHDIIIIRICKPPTRRNMTKLTFGRCLKYLKNWWMLDDFLALLVNIHCQEGCWNKSIKNRKTKR